MKQIFRILIATSVLLTAALVGLKAEGSGRVIEQKGSFLRPLQQRDSVLIADQLKYGFLLQGVKEGTGIALADFSKGFMDSVEVVSSWTLDTVKVYKGKKNEPSSYDIEGSIIITSFDEGVYDLRPLAVVRMTAPGEADTLVFDPQVLEVKTMPVDTATFQIHDIKGQIRYPVTASEVLPYAAGTIVLLALVAALVYYLRERKKKQEAQQAQEPAYIIALRKLDKYRGDKYWAPEKQKMFYSGITDALREYIVDRYDVEAMEMTTAEIFAGLKDKDIPKDLYVEMKTLFETADFVKFAKHIASEQENSAAVPSAVRFVTTTYQSILDAESSDPTQNDTQVEDQKQKEDESPEEKDYSAYMPK